MKVTQYQRQVKTNAISAPKLSLPEDTFGQSIAKGLGDIGSALGGVAQDMQERAKKTRFDSTKSALIQLENNNFYGDGGYKSLQGKAAFGVATKLREDFEKNLEKVTKDMPESMRSEFDGWARNEYYPTLHSAALQHEHAQMMAFEKNEATAHVNTIAEAAVFSCYDDNLFGQYQSQYDEALGNLATLIGYVDGDSRANFIKTNRSNLSVAVVQKMLTDDPSNPWKAQQFFQRMAKEGRIDAKGYEEVKKVLKPAVENAQANALVKKISDEVIANDVNDDPNQYGKPIAGFGKRAHEVLNDPNIPDHLKTKVIQGLAANEKAINASRAEAYAQNYNNVLLQVQKGVPVASAEGYEQLRPEDRNKLSWRAAGHSDVTSWSRLKTAQMNGTLTPAMVNEEVGNLSETDFRSFFQAATGNNVSVDTTTDKFIDKNLQLALSWAGEDDAFKSSFKSGEKYAEYRYYVTENVAEWRKRNPTKQLTMDEFSRIVYQTRRTIAAEKWGNVLWDERYNYREIRAENDARRAQGLGPEEGFIDDLILYGADGNAIKDSPSVVKRIQAQFGNVTLYPDDIVRYWVSLQQNPQAYAQFMSNK